jgi:hypothetical protein
MPIAVCAMAKVPLIRYSTTPFGSPPAIIVGAKQRITKNTPSPNEVKTANLNAELIRGWLALPAFKARAAFSLYFGSSTQTYR